ncbi:hypothetical protein [Candidatus Hakubella thermalkaliphila]|uniref:hypothetical protein n=1 Tax=Candidatus Hakubella thermalkaliphila TaxID=2754717 RepID=UPI001FE64255|nr:hypothetical protein [Candidatus Hakubella thermalkaliphila]
MGVVGPGGELEPGELGTGAEGLIIVDGELALIASVAEAVAPLLSDTTRITAYVPGLV